MKNFDLKNSKKGQITMYVILALVILGVVALAIYFNARTQETSFTRPDIDVDEQFAPVQFYVESCMNQVLFEGITKLGQHGGYIDPDDPSISNKLFRLNPMIQYDSDAAFISSLDRDSSVVYWIYANGPGDCQNCILNTHAPTIDDMQEQLSNYLEKNLGSCLNEYAILNDKGFTVLDDKKYNFRVSITDTEVAAILETNVYVRVLDDEGKLNLFYTENDVPLKKYYDLATNITISEIETNFLENVGIYLLTTHTGLDSNQLPPISDITTGYNVVYWSKSAVKNDFQSLLASYIAPIRIVGTKNDFEIDYTSLTPMEKYFYNATRLDMFKDKPEDFDETSISFSYTGQNIYLDIDPSSGELIKPIISKPQDFSMFFKGDIVNNYNFYYQISYPVIVEIRDEYKPGFEYSFIFALESAIVDNLRIRDFHNESITPIYWDESFVQTKINNPDGVVDLSEYNLDGNFDTTISDEDLNLNSQNIVDRMASPGYCDLSQRISGNVTLKIYDSVTNMPIENADVSFTCGNFITCNSGRSVIIDSEAVFTSKFPTCKNGYLKLSKEGYVPGNILISTNTKTEQNLGSIYLDPVITKEFALTKYQVIRSQNVPGVDPVLEVLDIPESVTENESITITLERVSNDPLEEAYLTTAIYSVDYRSVEKTIDLTPGSYILKIQLLDSAGVIIPKECKRVCVEASGAIGAVFGDGCKEYGYYPEENLEIKPAPWGGIEFSTQTYVYISPEDLRSNKVLNFNLFKLPPPLCIDDMDLMSQLEKLASRDTDKYLPKFIDKSEVNN